MIPGTKGRPLDEPRLRLYAEPEQGPDDGTPSAADTLTLSQFYDLVAPRFRGDVQKETIRQDRLAIGRWREITKDPPLAQITMETGEVFRKGLEQRKYRGEKISSNTVRKYLVAIQTILDLAGPTLRRELPRAELLERTPYLAKPKTIRPSPSTYALSELDEVLRATAGAYQAKNLRGVPAATWWRSLVVFAYNTALRADTLMSITWELLDLDRRDWLTIPPNFLKHGQQEEDFFVNRYARQAIDALKPGAKPRDPIFAWEGWPEKFSGFYEHLRAIFAASTLPPRRQRLRLHGLRRTCLTWAIGENWLVAQIIAGHHTGNVTQEHYANRHRLVPPVLSRLPQPRPAGQKTLF